MECESNLIGNPGNEVEGSNSSSSTEGIHHSNQISGLEKKENISKSMSEAATLMEKPSEDHQPNGLHDVFNDHEQQDAEVKGDHHEEHYIGGHQTFVSPTSDSKESGVAETDSSPENLESNYSGSTEEFTGQNETVNVAESCLLTEGKNLAPSSCESQSKVILSFKVGGKSHSIGKGLNHDSSLSEKAKSKKVYARHTNRGRKYSEHCIVEPAAKRIRSQSQNAENVIDQDCGQHNSRTMDVCPASEPPSANLPAEANAPSKDGDATPKCEKIESSIIKGGKITISIDGGSLANFSSSHNRTPVKRPTRRLGQFRKRNVARFSVVIRATESDLETMVGELCDSVSKMNCLPFEISDLHSKSLSTECDSCKKSISTSQDFESDVAMASATSNPPIETEGVSRGDIFNELRMNEKSVEEQISEMNRYFDDIINQLSETLKIDSNDGNGKEDAINNTVDDSVSRNNADFHSLTSTPIQPETESYVYQSEPPKAPSFEYNDLNEKYVDDSGDYTNSGVVIIDDIIGKNDCLERSDTEDGRSYVGDSCNRVKHVGESGDVPAISSEDFDVLASSSEIVLTPIDSLESEADPPLCMQISNDILEEVAKAEPKKDVEQLDKTNPGDESKELVDDADLFQSGSFVEPDTSPTAVSEPRTFEMEEDNDILLSCDAEKEDEMLTHVTREVPTELHYSF